METITAFHYKTKVPLKIHVKDGSFIHIEEFKTKTTQLPYIAPGFVDLQINGYGGIDFNTLPICPEDMLEVTRKLWEQGVTTYFPTIITNHIDTLLEIMRTLNKIRADFSVLQEAIGGIHLEGPFISPEDGPRGAHKKEYVQPPNWKLFKQIQESSGGLIKLITLSPEWTEAPSFIQAAASEDLVVSIGHTAATQAQINKAIDAGAKMSTHLGNGAHLMLPRHPNYIWDQLACDDLGAGVIADGFHLPDSVLKTILKMKGNKAFIVSDSVSLAGMPPGEYELHIGGKVKLTEEGRLHIVDHPHLLAGSAQTQLWGINYLIRRTICSPSAAIDLAPVLPGAWMKLRQRGAIKVQCPADFILYYESFNREINLWKTYKKGQMVYENRGIDL